MKLDSSSKILVLSNVFTIILAVSLGYGFAVLIWAYWLESVVIGIFAFLKLMIGGIKQAKTMPTGIFLALFFAFHYGMFHFGYLIFLSVLPWFSVNQSEVSWVLLTGGILLASHTFSFYENVLRKWREIPYGAKAAKLQFREPYSRILPMHMTIILSGFAVGFFGIEGNVLLLLLFMGLKTVSDLYFHMVKHKLN